MNVSKQAHAEFMRRLESEDPQRYAALLRNMRHTATRIGRPRLAISVKARIARRREQWRDSQRSIRLSVNKNGLQPIETT
jgi:hypothetical protein